MVSSPHRHARLGTLATEGSAIGAPADDTGVIMSRTDVDYYRERAARERVLAKTSSQANVAAIHEELAGQYEALVDQAELRPNLHR